MLCLSNIIAVINSIIKAHLEREIQHTGQREFVLGLIEEALEAAEQQADSPEPEEPPQGEAGVSPCEAGSEGGGIQSLEGAPPPR